MLNLCFLPRLVLAITYEKSSLQWSWLQTQQQWNEQIEAWLDSWAPLQGVEPSSFSNLASLLATLICLALVYWVLVLVWRARRPWSSQPPSPQAASAAAPTDSSSWLKRARALQQASDYRGACLALYQAFLGRLAERQIVGTLTSRTDGEYRRLLASQPNAETAATLFDIHERLAYGEEAATAEICERCVQAYEQWR